MTDEKQFKTIDEYIQTFPTTTQVILEKIRQTIAAAAPEAVETISYGIPVFNLNGTYLTYFAGWKDHVAIYPIPRGDETLQKELAPYIHGKGTLRFPLDQPIPYDLVKKAVLAQMEENQNKHNLQSNFMSDVLIVKNISHEGPGLLEDVLREANISATTIDLQRGELFPSPIGYKALIVLGGPDSANDQTAKMTQEIAQISTALAAGIPYLGICLGMQALVKAAGGTVVRAAQKEIGFTDPAGDQYTIDLTEIGKTDPLFAGLADSLPVFHLHGETVQLTDSMDILGTGKYCKNQIVKVADRTYGIQSHFELTETMLGQWAKIDPDLLLIDENTLVASYEIIKDTYSTIGRTLFNNFLKIARVE